jgi:hypothetical protein
LIVAVDEDRFHGESEGLGSAVFTLFGIAGYIQRPVAL